MAAGEWASQVPGLGEIVATLNMQVNFPVPHHNMSPHNVREPPQKGAQNSLNLCTLAADSPKPKTDHILGYVAQNALWSTSNTPTTTQFFVATTP